MALNIVFTILYNHHQYFQNLSSPPNRNSLTTNSLFPSFPPATTELGSFLSPEVSQPQPPLHFPSHPLLLLISSLPDLCPLSSMFKSLRHSLDIKERKRLSMTSHLFQLLSLSLSLSSTLHPHSLPHQFLAVGLSSPPLPGTASGQSHQLPRCDSHWHLQLSS